MARVVRNKSSIEAHQSAQEALEQIKKTTESMIEQAQTTVEATKPAEYTVKEVTREEGEPIKTVTGERGRAEKGMFVLTDNESKIQFAMPQQQLNEMFEDVD